jgi:hypothetical protein
MIDMRVIHHCGQRGFSVSGRKFVGGMFFPKSREIWFRHGRDYMRRIASERQIHAKPNENSLVILFGSKRRTHQQCFRAPLRCAKACGSKEGFLF